MRHRRHWQDRRPELGERNKAVDAALAVDIENDNAGWMALARPIGAGNGEQEAMLNGVAFAIGTLAGAGGIPSGFARDVLKWAAEQFVSYDPRRPWRAGEARQKVERAFAAGLRSPRRATG